MTIPRQAFEFWLDEEWANLIGGERYEVAEQLTTQSKQLNEDLK